MDDYMPTMEHFLKTIGRRRINEKERNFLMVISNNKLIWKFPGFDFHYTLCFLENGKADLHRTIEGKKKKYRPYGLVDFDLMRERILKRVDKAFSTCSSFPLGKARRNKWKCYQIILPEISKYKKFRVKEFLREKIIKKRIDARHVEEYDDVMVYTKKSGFVGFVKKGRFVDIAKLKEIRNILIEEYEAARTSATSPRA
ncbi:MAG: hypothetical protein AB1468_05665 [Candidatus Micrarchaeota archaeon]